MSDESLPFLAKLVEVLEREKVPYVLIGAFAMMARNAGRATFDVDFMTTDSRTLKMDWPLLVRLDVPVEVRRGEHDDPLAGVIRFAPPSQMSFDLVVGKWKWQKDIIDRAERFDVRGTILPVARVADICLQKIDTGGPQDARDAAMLLERFPSAAQELRQLSASLPESLRKACEAFLAAHSS
ncbi:MAG TPA: hypothetical protein VHL58_18960 [Thermoanaerobaculia bacterium]|nr:hypothetical protein [Thermoanaerobaculia bacterium]